MNDITSQQQTQAKIPNNNVSKAKLDVYVPAKQEGLRATTFEAANDIAGFRRLRDVARSANASVCVEPTGGYELELIALDDSNSGFRLTGRCGVGLHEIVEVAHHPAVMSAELTRIVNIFVAF